MDLLQAIILGVVQGLTEFIPVSSSAHLVVIPWFLHWKTPGLAFDASLHLGTLLALLIYFWRDWDGSLWENIRKGSDSNFLGASRSLLIPIIFACIPGGIAGFMLEGTIERYFRTPLVIGSATIILGLLLFVADRVGRRSRPMETIGPKDWIIIGLAQALAIIPGVSRSGISITAGLFCGLRREAAAKFSFLIGSPLIFGAAVYELLKVTHNGLYANQVMAFAAGVITAMVVGYFCMSFLIAYLKKKSPGVFVVYRIIFGAAVIVYYFMQR